MATPAPFQYLNNLQGRVRCYLKRLQEEEAWETHCTSHNLQTANRSHFNVNKKELHGKELREVSKATQTPKRPITDNSKFKLEPTNERKFLLIGKNSVAITKPSQQKEFVIKTSHDHKRLSKVSQDASVKRKTIQESERKDYLSQNDKPRVPYSQTGLLPSPVQYPYKLETHSSGKNIKKENYHKFQTPSTIVFLESFVWDKLLQDTISELERIAINQAKKKKEFMLLNFRKHIRDLQNKTKVVPETKFISEEIRKEVKPYSVKSLPASEKSTDKQQKQSSTGAKPTPVVTKTSTEISVSKLDPIVLKMSEESVRSVLQNRSEFQNYIHRIWPPLSGIEDFHQTSIQVSDSILEDALNEIILEVEQISGHIIQSCLVQEIGSI